MGRWVRLKAALCDLVGAIPWLGARYSTEVLRSDG